MLLNGSKGQAAVESVLVIPALVMLYLCILQTALFLFTYYIVDYASYCGARAAIVHCRLPDNPGIAARSAVLIALSALGPGLESAAGAGFTRCIILGDEYEVTVTYPCRSIVPLLVNILDRLPITASTRLPIAG